LSPYAAIDHFDYLAALRREFADNDRLRMHALKADGAIRDPVAFNRALGSRLKLIVRSVKLEREIYDLRRSQSFFDAILREVAAASPEVSHRIVDRMRALSASLHSS
jgi:hypothetical protein